ncbi:MAG: hypothetical protein Q8R79_01315 [Legionellaceae bacterium]|nr:hypothetical protein [Legionellaceae bacterium]
MNNHFTYSQKLDPVSLYGTSFRLGASERAEGVYSQSMTDGERTSNNAENPSAKSIFKMVLLVCILTLTACHTKSHHSRWCHARYQDLTFSEQYPVYMQAIGKIHPTPSERFHLPFWQTFLLPEKTQDPELFAIFSLNDEPALQTQHNISIQSAALHFPATLEAWYSTQYLPEGNHAPVWYGVIHLVPTPLDPFQHLSAPITLRVTEIKSHVLTLPRSAIHWIQGVALVHVKTAEGIQARIISTQEHNDRYVHVLAGISTQEIVQCVY